ncbi:hypothetical protein [Methylobacterium sp. CM6247]
MFRQAMVDVFDHPNIEVRLNVRVTRVHKLNGFNTEIERSAGYTYTTRLFEDMTHALKLWRAPGANVGSDWSRPHVALLNEQRGGTPAHPVAELSDIDLTVIGDAGIEIGKGINFLYQPLIVDRLTDPISSLCISVYSAKAGAGVQMVAPNTFPIFIGPPKPVYTKEPFCAFNLAASQ